MLLVQNRRSSGTRLQYFVYGGGEPFDLRARGHFRDAHQSALFLAGIIFVEGKRADDFLHEQFLVDLFYGPRKVHDELVESFSGEGKRDTGNLLHHIAREMRLGKILRCEFAHAFFTEKTEMNRDDQRVERFVGADIGSGFLAADVLLARGKSEAKSAASSAIGGFARKPSGHSAHELVARGNYADVRTAVTRRDAETLRFERDDVSFFRRFDDAESQRLSDASDEERAVLVRRLRDRAERFENAEEIRRLHDYRGGLFPCVSAN